MHNACDDYRDYLCVIVCYHARLASARIRLVTIGGLALLNKHKSGCMVDKETNIHAHYVILYDVIVYQHA